MVLLINACARPESRTLPLARKAAKKISSDVNVLNLYEKKALPLDYESLSKREAFVNNKDYNDEMFNFAHQFKAAETIVIAAPYWDLSFPSILKCYFESVCVQGLTFYYNEKGMPVGLCLAKKLIYVTTAGGYIPENNYGFNYIKQLCSDFFGINDAVCIKAQGLDIYSADVEDILKKAEEEIERLL